jgi:hypothetical protein
MRIAVSKKVRCQMGFLVIYFMGVPVSEFFALINASRRIFAFVRGDMRYIYACERRLLRSVYTTRYT